MNVLRQLAGKLFSKAAVTVPMEKRVLPTPSSFIRRVQQFPEAFTDNPGVQVFTDLCSEHQEQRLLQEAESLRTEYSFAACEPMVLSSTGSADGGGGGGGEHTIEAHRVTGRPEYDYQKPAPWGYGDTFSRTVLESFPGLNQMAQTLEAIVLAESGANTQLRDITINYRQRSMYMLDPHLDPSEDGGHVFILGMLSDTVLTLTPDLEQLRVERAQSAPNWKQKGKKHRGQETPPSPLPSFPGVPHPLKVRTAPPAISLSSWSDADIDVLLKRRYITHLSGPARYAWKHAIRTGLDVDRAGLPLPHDIPGTGPVICDWWGSLEHLVPRGGDRVSIIFAFR
ncbi:hypothetical protein B484DRAFT_456855 [Ochromonadaceae sp. CCMP2298]|nr:hypothetical protein B484DRAFT_456855 [Ochromonadaceae sp. CCMP2298]